MPYLLKEYFSGATLAASSHDPTAADGAEQFDQLGWSPQAARLPVAKDGVYRLENPHTPGVRHRIRVTQVSLAANAISYVIEGEVCITCCAHMATDLAAA